MLSGEPSEAERGLRTFFDKQIMRRRSRPEIFPKSAAIGWDIALTDQGPLLLEANPNWCVEVVQMAHGAPLGATILPSLLMSHLDRREQALRVP